MNRSSPIPLQRVLFLASEISPFAKTGGLGDVTSSLPAALSRLGLDVVVASPLYRQVRESGQSLTVIDEPLSVPFRHRDLKTRAFTHRTSSGVRIYFIERDELYDRGGLYGTPDGDYFDNDSRFIFFCLAALELVRRLHFRPDVIHCNDWQTGLVPVYVRQTKRHESFFRSAGLLFTIHNLAYQGLFPPESMAETGLPAELYSMNGLEFHGRLNFMKGGIVYSDRINTVSPRYAREIQTTEQGNGLDGLLRVRSGVLSGILNGIDDTVWNPETDPHIASPYGPDGPDGKAACKIDLMKQFNLEGPATRPIAGMVTRLADQKGLELVADAVERLCDLGLSLVIQGRGDSAYEDRFREIGKRFPGRVGVRIAFDEALAHKIEAGADMFLMPSLYEPCGLNQMYSLRYGTIPVVRATGGLDDTIREFDPRTKRGNGFKFLAYNSGALVAAVRRAVKVFETPALWRRLMKTGMSSDFSWNRAAGEYLSLYERTRPTVQTPSPDSAETRSGRDE